MIGRSRRDESGVALGLAVIVVVLIGVLAAAHPMAARPERHWTWAKAPRGRPFGT